MSVSVSYADVLRMLENCAKGYNIRRTTHGRRVEFNGRVYLDLPKHDQIEIGHLRNKRLIGEGGAPDVRDLRQVSPSRHSARQMTDRLSLTNALTDANIDRQEGRAHRDRNLRRNPRQRCDKAGFGTH